MTKAAQPLAALRSVSKSFGATRALVDVTVELWGGEVHVLAGQNGAGKSTLIRILSGVYRDYRGQLEVAGRRQTFRGPGDAMEAGIAAIDQELSLVGPMSVADNLLLSERGSVFGWCDRGSRTARARDLLSALGLDVDPDLAVERLPLGARQLVEVARALGRSARVLIMDEPTSALGEAEAERLFEQVADLRDRGCAILYISHRLEEIDRLADRITVLRDGHAVRSAPARELDRDALVETMVGRTLAAEPTADSRLGGTEPLFSAQHIRVPGPSGRMLVDEVSLTIGAGEILGLAGLEGSGAALIPYALFGATEASMTAALDGQPLTRPNPARCIARQVVLSSGDRGASLVPALSVTHNASLSSLARFSRSGWVRAAAERRAVREMVERLEVDCPSLDAPLWQLSGGNQQKVALARGLLSQPRVFLLDEPTRGIDVGAKRDVYALVRELSAQGVAILLVSSEIDELVQLCHRVSVMARGRVVAELAGGDITRRRIVRAALGHEEAA